MQQYKQHIPAVLLMGFLLPQLASSLHYYVVPHESAKENSHAFVQVNPDLRFHSCLFHLKAFTTILPAEDFQEVLKIQFPTATGNFCSLENYIHQPDFHFQLRGPPVL